MAKLVETFEIHKDSLVSFLLEGDLLSFEQALYQSVLRFYEHLAEKLLVEVLESEPFISRLSTYQQQQKMCKHNFRKASLQLLTGKYIDLPAQYSAKVPSSHRGSRYALHQYFGVLRGASPAFYSQICQLGVLCSSFEIATKILKGLGYHISLDRLRCLCLCLGEVSLSERASAALNKDESVADKWVTIGIDGGRTRIREYTDVLNEKKTHYLFNTPWKEPKLLIIKVRTDEGAEKKMTFPLCDVTFGEANFVALLREYLIALQIPLAKGVQLLADGATWIWNQVPALLTELGVAKEKITETLDYYHASQHLNQMLLCLPQKVQKEGNYTFKALKTKLWEGNIQFIITAIKTSCKRISKALKTEIAYFEKNYDRMQYQVCRAMGWCCGSGMVESAVKRMINLRFKGASYFWKQGNLDGLFFLRCALLNGRWQNVITNITKNN
jgi:uncharacterized membrane protein